MQNRLRSTRADLYNQNKAAAVSLENSFVGYIMNFRCSFKTTQKEVSVEGSIMSSRV